MHRSTLMRLRSWKALVGGLLLAPTIAIIGVAGASTSQTKATLPTKTSTDVQNLVTRENAVLADLKTFQKLGKTASVAAIAAKLKADVSAQSSAASVVANDLSSSKPAPAPKGGNGSSPSSPIPLGQSGNIDGWKVKVISFTTEPTNSLTYQPPPAGYAFMVYTLQTTRTDSKPEAPILLTPKLLGPSKAERSSISSPICLGGSPYNDQVHQGGTVTTGGCISVKSSDVGHLVLGVGLFHDIWFATQ